jgi:hypothetical protein
VVTVATEPLPVTTELPGRIDAVRTAAAGTSSRLRHKTAIFGQLAEYLCKIIPRTIAVISARIIKCIAASQKINQN